MIAQHRISLTAFKHNRIDTNHVAFYSGWIGTCDLDDQLQWLLGIERHTVNRDRSRSQYIRCVQVSFFDCC